MRCQYIFKIGSQCMGKVRYEIIYKDGSKFYCGRHTFANVQDNRIRIRILDFRYKRCRNHVREMSNEI